MDDVMKELLGGEMASLMGLLWVCGEEVERAEPVTGKLSSARFMLLAPGDVFRGLHPELYRAHVRELLERYADGTPLDVGTKAEVLVGLVAASLNAPLTRHGQLLYCHCFRECMGEAMYGRAFGDETFGREQWPGQLEEELHGARRQIKTGRPRRVP
jgi:hypothetical protein